MFFVIVNLAPVLLQSEVRGFIGDKLIAADPARYKLNYVNGAFG